LSESGSRLFLILSSTDRCCLVDNTSVNLLMWFPSVCECHPEGPRKGITKAPGVTKETLTCMLQKFGHGCTVSDQQPASRMCVLPSQGVGSKQGNLGSSLCHVARRCELFRESDCGNPTGALRSFCCDPQCACPTYPPHESRTCACT
jgi:hypothetical protein